MRGQMMTKTTPTMSDPHQPVSADAANPPATNDRTKLRLLAVALLLGVLYLVGKYTGIIDKIDITTIRRTVEEAGGWGFAVFVAVFAVGVLLQVPGMLFVATGILVYGKTTGFFANLTGAIVAVCASFIMVRTVGGKALGEVKRPWMKRMLERLDDKPIRWLMVLRLIAFISPPLNYALALTRLRFRDYAIGSALGLVTPMAVVTLMFDWLFETPWAKAMLFGGG